MERELVGFSALELEAIAYYESRYNVILDRPLVSDRPLRLSDQSGEQVRRCRFCGGAGPEVTFRSIAHAVPEFLGNKSLISLNECDACNTFLADNYEDHLAKWLGPFRTVSQIHGKSGVPIYKDKDSEHGGRIRIERRDGVLHFDITGADVPLLRGPLLIDTPSQPYIPIRAAKALVKVACSMCPAGELPQCAIAIDWLMEHLSAYISPFPVLCAFSPGPNPYASGSVMLLRRKVDEPIPYLWCIIATANYRFQFFVPFCPNDTWFNNGSQSLFQARHLPVWLGDDWPFGATDYRLFDWSGEKPIVSRAQVTLNVDQMVRLKGPWQ